MTEFSASVTQTEQRSVEPAVMGSEIEQLPDLSGYLKVASSQAWQRVRLRPVAAELRAEPTVGTARILTFPRAATAATAQLPAATAADPHRAAPHDGLELE